jgi:uncharacterized RDD family membrane protein YckC
MAADLKTESARRAGVFRRLAALLYDSLLLTAILMVATLPVVMLNGGQFLDGSPYAQLKNVAYFLYLVGIIFLFYGWCWTRGGQTLGMAAWRIRTLSLDNARLSWSQAWIRFSTSLLGLANLWVWLDPQKRGWHERLSGTHTVLMPKTP